MQFPVPDSSTEPPIHFAQHDRIATVVGNRQYVREHIEAMRKVVAQNLVAQVQPVFLKAKYHNRIPTRVRDVQPSSKMTATIYVTLDHAFGNDLMLPGFQIERNQT